MNSDNCAVGGHTLDFGPFGYVQRFAPAWNPFTSDLEGKFGFLRQPRAVQINVVSLARALMPVVAVAVGPHDQSRLAGVASALQAVVTTEFEAELAAAMHTLRVRKLGLARDTPAAAAEALWTGLVGEVPPVEEGGTGAPGLLEAAWMDWTVFWRQLAEVAAAGPGVPAADAAWSLGAAATYDDDVFAKRVPQWTDWIEQWRTHLPQADADRAAAVATMTEVSPLYVPREWLLARAYTAAEVGDHQPLHEALRVFAAPFTRHPDADVHTRFSRRTPRAMLAKAGIAFFS